jgi:hypothetical protein
MFFHGISPLIHQNNGWLRNIILYHENKEPHESVGWKAED